MTDLVKVEVVRHSEIDLYRTPTPSAGFFAQAFLAGYSGRTRESYETTLRQWGSWCQSKDVDVLAVTRAHVQVYARELDEAGRAPATVSQKLSAISGFYSYLVIEGALAKSPVAHVRRPKVSDESPRFGLDKAELRQLLEVANTHSPQAHALVCLMSLNGLRVTEACRARVQDLDVELGHQVLAVLRKGGKKARVPLAGRTATALRLLGRTDNELLIGLDRYGAWRLIRQLVDSAGITKQISPHSLRHTFVTLALEAGVPLHIVQDGAGHADPRTTQRYNRGRKRLDNHATFALEHFLEE